MFPSMNTFAYGSNDFGNIVGAYFDTAYHGFLTNITVVIFCWHILLISESMDHHDSEIMDDRSID